MRDEVVTPAETSPLEIARNPTIESRGIGNDLTKGLRFNVSLKIMVTNKPVMSFFCFQSMFKEMKESNGFEFTGSTDEIIWRIHKLGNIPRSS